MVNRVLGPRMPGSEHIPFRPINPHGSRPVVKDANGNLIEWKSPLREQLYRVMVEDREGNLINASPATQQQYAVEFCSMVNRMIREGKETIWSNPHVVKAL